MAHPSSPWWKRVSALAWHHPHHSVSAELRARSLVTHVVEVFHQQGMVSPSPGALPNQAGTLLSLHHAVGSAPAGGMDALLPPAVMEQLNGSSSNGNRFEAQPAYGSPPPMTNSP